MLEPDPDATGCSEVSVDVDLSKPDDRGASPFSEGADPFGWYCPFLASPKPDQDLLLPFEADLACLGELGKGAETGETGGVVCRGMDSKGASSTGVLGLSRETECAGNGGL